MTQLGMFDEEKNVVKQDGCWQWKGSKTDSGYGVIKVQGVLIGAHRFSWEMNFGKIQSGLCVLHKCDNPGCTNPEHLFLGTHQDNITDMISKGRKSTKLTEQQILEIRALANKKIKREIIAKKYNISLTYVSLIKLKQVWAHI